MHCHSQCVPWNFCCLFNLRCENKACISLALNSKLGGLCGEYLLLLVNPIFYYGTAENVSTASVVINLLEVLPELLDFYCIYLQSLASVDRSVCLATVFERYPFSMCLFFPQKMHIPQSALIAPSGD